LGERDRGLAMAKVLGLGGVFYKAEDPAAVRDWYARVLGFEIHSWGGAVFKSPRTATTNWALFGADSQYFAPSTAPFMINFVVDDIDGVLAKAAAEGVEPLPPGRRRHGPFRLADRPGRG